MDAMYSTTQAILLDTFMARIKSMAQTEKQTSKTYNVPSLICVGGENGGFLPTIYKSVTQPQNRWTVLVVGNC